MEETVNKAIEALAKRITDDVKADDALKFTQAALNLAHVLAVRDNIKRQNQ